MDSLQKMGTGLAPRGRLALSLGAGLFALGLAYGVAGGLRRAAARGSHQVPTPEAWFERATPASAQSVARGRAQFLSSCAHCHGADATGDEGPDLHGLEVSDRYISTLITRGIKGEMPSFRRKLGVAEIGDLTSYLRSLG